MPLLASSFINGKVAVFNALVADKGIKQALNENKHLMNGLNIQNGKIIHPAIKEALDS